MKVILLEKVENLGEKYDIKDVAVGFARNFLIPRGLAKIVNNSSLQWVKRLKTEEIKQTEGDLKSFQKVVSEIDGREILIPVKTGEKKQLFESVTSQRILERLHEMGFDIKKRQIILEKPIKDLGEFPLKILFDHNLEAEIKIIVTEKK